MSVPVYKQIQTDIFSLISSGRLREGDRVASESEIMKKYYVSSITAKNALNALADQGLVHRVKGKGTFVVPSPFSVPVQQRKNTGITIGAAFPGTVIYIQYLDEYCQQNGMSLYIRYARESSEIEAEILQRFADDGISGILLFPAVSETSNPCVTRLVKEKFPIVFLDRYLPNVESSHVVADNRQGACLATEYLLNAVGRNVTILHFPPCNNTVIDRLAGFRDAFRAAGEKADDSNICAIDDLKLLNKESEERIKHIHSRIVAHLRENSNIRGFFATNLEIAQVSYYTVRLLGFTPGVDFHIVSFDNPYLPGIHFIKQDFRRMAESAMKLLRRQIDGDFTVVHDRVPTRFTHMDISPTSLNDLQDLGKYLNSNT
ncbi:MAG: LacI family transcriptional regulator [Clostridiales bacterium]|jgi:DNA-binding LacI/PurR family transcriptional regulator|nr:LacI family transcriptional regulator [Clostridiales bacterium]